MIVPPVGGLAGQLSVGQSAAQTPTAGSGLEGAGGVEGSSGLSGGTGALGGSAGEGGFGGELSEAISSLEKTQQASDSASQALATGTVKDPASAVVTVEDAQLAMQLASQIRTKATEAAQTIFQTQV